MDFDENWYPGHIWYDESENDYPDDHRGRGGEKPKDNGISPLPYGFKSLTQEQTMLIWIIQASLPKYQYTTVHDVTKHTTEESNLWNIITYIC